MPVFARKRIKIVFDRAVPDDVACLQGIAYDKAKLWAPRIKSRAQVKRHRFRQGIHKGKRTRLKARRYNPLDWHTRERVLLLESNEILRQLFGDILEPCITIARRRGRIPSDQRIILPDDPI